MCIRDRLWVNLPAAHKMDDPGYQALTAESLGKVKPIDGGQVNLYAGELDGESGPARTATPINLWDIHLGPGEDTTLTVPDGHTTMLFVIDGEVATDGGRLDSQQLGLFERTGDELRLRAGELGARALLLGGEPIGEPTVSYGPFVMNTEAEIVQAVQDFNAGTFGRL